MLIKHANRRRNLTESRISLPNDVRRKLRSPRGENVAAVFRLNARTGPERTGPDPPPPRVESTQ